MEKDEKPSEKEEKEARDEKKQEESVIKEKMSSCIDTVSCFVTKHTRDVIVATILFFGVVIAFFHHLWGGLIIGVMGGTYFSDEIIQFFGNLVRQFEQQGMLRSLIILGIFVSFFILAPSIIIGGAVAMGIRHLLVSK